MITVNRKPGLAETGKYMERLRFLLLGMKDFISNILEGDGGRYNTSPTYFGNAGPGNTFH